MGIWNVVFRIQKEKQFVVQHSSGIYIRVQHFAM